MYFIDGEMPVNQPELNKRNKFVAAWNLFSKNKQNGIKDKYLISESVNIDFGEVLDFSYAAKLHMQLKNEIKNNSTVNFVSADLTRIDASCL